MTLTQISSVEYSRKRLERLIWKYSKVLFKVLLEGVADDLDIEVGERGLIGIVWESPHIRKV